MPPTRLSVNNTQMLRVRFTLGFAIHTREEPLKQSWLTSDNIETNRDFDFQTWSEGAVSFSQQNCQDPSYSSE